MTPKTAVDAINIALKTHSTEIAFIHRQPFYTKQWSYSEVHTTVTAIIGYLQLKQLKKGDAVAICAPNSPWWVCVYLACATLGITIVPLDFNSTNDFIHDVTKKTKTKLLFISAYKSYTYTDVELITIEDLSTKINNLTHDPARLPKIHADDILEIVFTSGSTSTPKGVVLTHANVMSNVSNFLEVWPKEKNQISLSLVPLSHMLEQTAGFWAPFLLGAKIVYISSLRPTEIANAITEESVTSIITVPAFLQLLRRKILMQLSDNSFSSNIATRLLAVARNKPIPIARLLTRPIRNKLGSKLSMVAVGGASLPVDVESFWNNLGIYTIQGYGLTETSPLATYSSKKEHKPLSVGKILPNQQLKISDQGEILLKGSNVFSGYFENAKETRAVIDKEGWFHTGDIGLLDEDGFLFLKGRLKNMLLSPNGLNIYPEDIEAKVLNYSEIKDAIVIMDQSILTAVVLSDASMNRLKEIIKVVNKELASHQNINNIIVWPDGDFPRTPTKKIIRKHVQETIANNFTSKKQTPMQDTNKLHEVLRQVSGYEYSFEDSQILHSDLAIDSIKRLELVSLLEEKFLTVIDESQITQNTTVEQLAELVNQSRKNQKSRSRSNHTITKNKLALLLQSLIQQCMLLPIAYYQKLHVKGHFTTDAPVIYVANHTSHFDALTFLRLAGFKQRKKLVIVAAADYFFNTPLKKWLAKNMLHAIPVARDGNARDGLALIGKELSRGNSVIVFPEGSRSTDGNIHTFKPGIGFLASQIDVPIIPIKLIGNYQILPKGKHIPKKGITTVLIGKPKQYSITQTPNSIAQDLQTEVEKL